MIVRSINILTYIFTSLKNRITVQYINLLIVLLVLSLPYYLFDGNLFIGGDDTHLQYVYPLEWIKNISFFSWFNFSSVGAYHPSQYPLPFLLIWILIKEIFQSLTFISYFTFSLPIIVGFIYFQKVVKELFDVRSDIALSGSLFYILSPIIAVTPLSSFLYAAWLIGYAPLLMYIFLRYQKTAQMKYAFYGILASIFFSMSFISIPWILGVIIPISFSLILCALLYSRAEILFFAKKLIVFFSLIFLSQQFWMLPFALSFFQRADSSFGDKVFSVQDSYIQTVLATSNGNNIFFPLLNLFHRQLAISFEWSLSNVFFGFYDNLIIINLVYPIFLFTGLLMLSKKSSVNAFNRKYYVFLLAFLFALYFFTVNIGPLKDVFLWLGNIPGFVMFRNFYDKFALGYVFYYSLIITFSLNIIVNRLPIYSKIVIFIFLTVVTVNFLPVKNIINDPLWRTQSIYTNINLPTEYYEFLSNIKYRISSTTNILSLPFNIASYSVIKDVKTSNIFAGTSPIKLFTGVNDFSGNLSFSPSTAVDLNIILQNRDYKSMEAFLKNYNIGYVAVTNNVPDEVLKSYLYNQKTVMVQDQAMINSITSRLVYESSSGNYKLYKTNFDTSILYSENLIFQKINPVKYKLYIKDIDQQQKIVFYDSFHQGWKFYPVESPDFSWCDEKLGTNPNGVVVCNDSFSLFELNDLFYTFKKSLFHDQHFVHNDYANVWVIDSKAIMSDVAVNNYKINPDGTIDIELVMYFLPQNYFYIGLFITFFVVLFISIYTIKNK